MFSVMRGVRVYREMLRSAMWESETTRIFTQLQRSFAQLV
jgi:hypothetical protein